MEKYAYSSYPDSGDPSPLSRKIECENPPWDEPPQQASSLNYKVKFMCSYGGKIQPRPHDNQLAYVGGETKILAVDRTVKFSAIKSKLSSLIPDVDAVCFKYQLPGEDLDALISVTNDEDLEHMMSEYDCLYRASAKPARLRLFLFPLLNPNAAPVLATFGSSQQQQQQQKSERQWFVDALNSVQIDGSSPPANRDFPFGLDKGFPPPKVPDAAMKDVSFGADCGSEDRHLVREPVIPPPAIQRQQRLLDYDDGENLVGSKIRVWWPKDRTFYEGVVDSFVSETKKHKVTYTDGDQETLYLKKVKWELIGGDSVSDGEQATDHRSPDAPTKTSSKKKLKIISDERTKHGKMNASPKKVGGASSSKSKATSSKSYRKSRDGGKVDGKSKDDSLRTLNKSEDISSGKSKDHTPRSGSSKLVDAAPKLAGKSKNNDPDIPKTGKAKDDDTGTPRTSTKSKQDIAKTGKSKQDTSKSASISKGKNPKSGGKSSANNGTGKAKSDASSKIKEVEDTKENSSDSAKVPESTAKGKTPNSSEGQGSDSKSGKKRRRGAES